MAGEDALSGDVGDPCVPAQSWKGLKWWAPRDSNPDGLPTRPSNVGLCAFGSIELFNQHV